MAGNEDTYSIPLDYGEMYGETPEKDVKYAFKLTNSQGQDITLPLYVEDQQGFTYNTFKEDPAGNTSKDINYKILAHFKPISRPYGETILTDEKISINNDDTVVYYESKYLPRADELTGYIDLNIGTGKNDHDVFFPIRMGDMIETPTPSWTHTISWTPTMSYTPTMSISWTPTVSWTPTMSNTPTGSPVATPTPTITGTPDLQSAADVFRGLWSQSNDDYFNFYTKDGYFGMRFKYRRFIDDFYTGHTDGLFKPKKINNGKGLFNPIRKVVVQVENLTIEDKFLETGNYFGIVYRDHEFLENVNHEFTGSTWNNMVTTNTTTFAYGIDYGKAIVDTNSLDSPVKVIKEIEFYIPLNESTFGNNVNNVYNTFNAKNSNATSGSDDGYNNSVDSVYFIIPSNETSRYVIKNVKIFPTSARDDNNGYAIYESDEAYIYNNGDKIGGDTDPTYFYSMETPTPSFTPSPTMTQTITHPTPTPTFTISPTETVSHTPTPTVTITHPTPTPTFTVSYTPTITKTLRLFNVDEEKGVNIVGSLNIIQRDGTISLADSLFNIGPVFNLELDGNIDI